MRYMRCMDMCEMYEMHEIYATDEIHDMMGSW